MLKWLWRECRAIPGQLITTLVVAVILATGFTVWATVKDWDRFALVLVFVAVTTATFVLVNNALTLRDRYTPAPTDPAPPLSTEELKRSMTQAYIDASYTVGAAQWNPSDFAFSVTDNAGRYVVIYKHEGKDTLTLTTWRFLSPEEKALVEALPTARYARAQRRMRMEMARFGTWFDFTQIGFYSISVDISSLSEWWFQENAFNFLRRGNVLLYALVEELLDEASDWSSQQHTYSLPPDSVPSSDAAAAAGHDGQAGGSG